MGTCSRYRWSAAAAAASHLGSGWRCNGRQFCRTSYIGRPRLRSCTDHLFVMAIIWSQHYCIRQCTAPAIRYNRDTYCPPSDSKLTRSFSPNPTILRTRRHIPIGFRTKETTRGGASSPSEGWGSRPSACAYPSGFTFVQFVKNVVGI